MKILKNIDISEAHGPDNESNRIIKLCGDSVSKPVQLIFRDYYKEGTFLFLWKKASIVPIQKTTRKDLSQTIDQFYFYH